MKTAMFLSGVALLAFSMSACRGEARLTILFSGDERGWIVPAG